MADQIQPAFREVAHQLQRRYPGVRIVWAMSSTCGDGTFQQAIRYQAPIAVLKRLGLVTNGMLRGKGRGVSPLSVRFMAATSVGDGYSVTRSLDSESRKGCWDLCIYTGLVPRERPKFAVAEAARLLKQLARQASTA